MKIKKIGLYEISVVVFFLLLPVIAAAVEIKVFLHTAALAGTLLKWFVFSGVGLRLFSSGLKQALQPEFTAKVIFEIDNEKCYPVIRELGLANICFGVIGILSLFFPSFRFAAGMAGGLFFALAGLLHIFRTKTAEQESFAMVTDFYIAAVLFILLVLNAAQR
ncbi:hypothetical protein SAMN02745823_02980 [Sporobacter termitidis DSM 10068]|uniref:DoxX-like family protein n=1 Tax=Sporobacter termitidis DSM 10068 TaxID=1123282 RepID=A0A1M5YXV8_9FIRM|nr:DUF6790 family protein [Sporobacter termitidis]SHI16852.1 hypothetical protein SAMN02745823_02980 [Sporobacter termitidis DSM 10068]